MLDRAITAAGALEFATACKALTDSCKICHQSAEVGVIVIKEPDAAAFPDQDFRPTKRSFLTWKFVSAKTSQTYLKFQRPLAACSSFCVGYPKMARVLRVLRSTKTKAASSMR